MATTPLAERRQARREAKLVQARAITFRDCAVSYIAMHRGWRSKNHRAQWSATLEVYAYPIIGALPVGAVDIALTLHSTAMICPGARGRRPARSTPQASRRPWWLAREGWRAD